MIRCLRCGVGWNTFSALDHGLLHADWAMSAVQFVVETTRIADVVTVLISPPQGRGGGLTIGAAEGSDCALVIILLFLWHGRYSLCAAASRRKLLAGTRLALADFESMREVVVVCRTATAARGAASAVAQAIARTRARFWIIFSRTASGSGDRLGIVGRRACIATITAGTGTMSAVRLHVEPAGVADGAAVRSPPPERRGGNTAIGAPHTRRVSRRRSSCIVFERVAVGMLRTGGAGRLTWRMRSGVFGVSSGTAAVGVVGCFDASRSSSGLAVAVVVAAGVMLVVLPWSRSDATQVIIGISLSFETLFGGILVAMSGVVGTHVGWAAVAVGMSWARVTEGVAHVHTR